MSAKVASGEEQTLNASSVAAIRRGCLRVWSRSEGESLAALTLERMRGLEKGAPPSTGLRLLRGLELMMMIINNAQMRKTPEYKWSEKWYFFVFYSISSNKTIEAIDN